MIKDRSKGTEKRIQESTNALVQSVGSLGKNVVSLDLKREVLELERLMFIIINDFSIGKLYPEDQWLKDLRNAAQETAKVLELVGDETSKMMVEIWLETH